MFTGQSQKHVLRGKSDKLNVHSLQISVDFGSHIKGKTSFLRK